MNRLHMIDLSVADLDLAVLHVSTAQKPPVKLLVRLDQLNSVLAMLGIPPLSKNASRRTVRKGSKQKTPSRSAVMD